MSANEVTFCPRCGAEGEYREWLRGVYCLYCNVAADAKKKPSVRGHWCDGLASLNRGIYLGTPRVTKHGTIISCSDEYNDDETEEFIKYCPMCGVRLDG